MKNYIIIPARSSSTRLPNKMLLDETGWTLLQHTYDNALQCKDADEVYVVTPEQKIVDVCEENVMKVLQIEELASCGSHACMAAADKYLEPCNIINVQGDCPNIHHSVISQMIEYIEMYSEMVTPYYETVDRELAENPARIKMVTNQEDDLLYYSRHPIPHGDYYWKIHIGAYGFPYRKWSKLIKLYDKHVGPHNYAENLEQLMWHERGFKSHCIKSLSCNSIDTREDYDEFKRDCLDR